MRKLSKLFLLVFIVSLLLGSTLANGEVTIPELGNTYTFDVVESIWSYNFAGSNSGGMGFHFNNETFTCDDNIILTVVDVNSIYVSFTAAIGEETYTFLGSGEVLLNMMNLITYPFDLAFGVFFSWECCEETLDFPLHHMYHFPHQIMDDLFDEYTQTSYITDFFSSDEYITYTNVGGTFTNLGAVTIFTWALDSQWINENEHINYNGTYNLRIEYDTATEMLLKYQINLDYEGIYEDYPIDLESHQEVQQIETTTSSNSPGYTILISIQVIVTIGLFVTEKKKF